jgi:hypothetical protein
VSVDSYMYIYICICCKMWRVPCYNTMYFSFDYMGFLFIVSMAFFRIKPVCEVFKVCLIWKLIMHGNVFGGNTGRLSLSYK